MRIYCKKCGAPTEYISSKPKFCSSCGVSFSSAKEVPVMPTKQEKTQPPQKKLQAFIIEDEEETQEESFPSLGNMGGLDVDIEQNETQGVKFGDALGSSASDGENKFIRDPDPKMSQEQFLKQFKEEAGSIKNTAPNED